jgi:type IV pilus assembly protein PilM
MEHRVIGRASGADGEATMDVIVVAARREMIKGLVDAARGAGLRPEGVDLSAFGMIRALRDPGAAELGAGPSYEERMSNPQVVVSAVLYCNLGDVINLAVARGDMCLFTRVSQFGFEGIVQRLAERCALNLEHARQWLAHVGLEGPVEAIEGDPEVVAAAREVLDEGASKLVDELRMSLDYYGAQEAAVAVDSVVACGTGTTIPGLIDRIERELGLRVVAPRPEALAHLDASSAARLTLPLGLGMER